MTHTNTIATRKHNGARRLAAALVGAAAALLLAPASGTAATKFGSVLNKNVSRRTRSPPTTARGSRRSRARGS